MVYLQINATILETKQYEFSQSKLTFINDLQPINGYNGFTEKEGKKYQIKIAWKTRKNLDNFLKSEVYKFFHGALITLSETNETQIC